MDTETNRLVYLGDEELKEADALWKAWEAGLLKKQPRYAPVTGDTVPIKPKRRRTRAKRSYKDFCNG